MVEYQHKKIVWLLCCALFAAIIVCYWILNSSTTRMSIHAILFFTSIASLILSVYLLVSLSISFQAIQELNVNVREPFFFCCSHFCLMYSLALIWRLCCTSNLNPWWCERISGFITFMILCCVEWMYGEYRSDSQAQLKSTNGKIHMTQRIKRKY